MSAGRDRLAQLAAELGVAIEADTLDRLGATLDRLDATLTGDAVAAGGALPATPPPADPPPPLEVVLDRARLLEDGGSYTAVLADEARLAAEVVSRTRPAPALAGMTVAVKDLIAVAGHRIGAGSAAWVDEAPAAGDAPVVARLRQLGAVIVGLTALHEIAFGVTGINDVAGWPRNPHDSDRIPGGSSSGSAVAVAQGSAEVAVGTDTGGSLRIPAALCGVVGYKPAYGTYPTQGVLPLSPTLDHVGFMARRVAPLRRLHAAFGFDTGRDVLPSRVGVGLGDLEEADGPVAERVRGALAVLQRRGVSVLEVSWPDADAVVAVSTAVMFAEAAAVHRSTLVDRAARYGEDVRHRLLQGLAIPAATYAAALDRRTELRAQVAAVLAGVDCVVGPTVGLLAPTEEEGRRPSAPVRLVRHTRLANVVGAPALSLPLPGDGLPVGLQVMARDDARLLGMAAAIERAVG